MHTDYSDLFSIMPPLTKQDDFDDFWEKTLSASKSVPLNTKIKKTDYPSPYLEVYDVFYSGADSTPVHGLYMVPTFLRKDKYPLIIHYHGLGGNCGKPSDFLQWLMLGLAVFSIDIRDQRGLTFDHGKYNSGMMGSLFLRGILNKEEYYLKNIYTDSIRAIDFACEREETDKDKIIVEGGSQGGALATAVSALSDRPFLCLCDVPSNSNIIKRVEGKNGSFSAVFDYLAKNPDKIDLVYEVLSYFDTMNMADRIKCKTFASVCLKDDVCPAVHYFATYNRLKCEKQIEIYPFNSHEVLPVQNEKKLRFVADHLKEI